MPKKQEKILECFGRIAPLMTEREQDRLLDFGEGVAFMVNQRAAERSSPACEGTRERA